MSPDQESPPPQLQHLRELLEWLSETTSHLEVKKAVPDPEQAREVKDLEGMRRRVDEALAELASWESSQHSAVQIVKALNRSTTTIVGAMKANADQLGSILADQGGTGFEADPAVLAEGEFLKAQLTGVEGTEGGGPKFKDAPTTLPVNGLDLLADAVSTPSTSYQAPTR